MKINHIIWNILYARIQAYNIVWTLEKYLFIYLKIQTSNSDKMENSRNGSKQ